MKHLGDITKIKGADVAPVNVIIGGSPCQDLSIAGKRAGLAGGRSGLFMHEIRIIKEMRETDAKRGKSGKEIRPRFMVWENVPGAFSCNGGRDFQAVLEETIWVVEPEAPSVPIPEKGWPTNGCIVGDGWSIAWRVLDAKFWGVPQRRRRIALVADFGGKSAPEILFVRKSLQGNFEPGGKTWEGASEGAESRIVIPINDKATRYAGGGCTRHEDGSGNGFGVGQDGDPSPTLTAGDRHGVAVLYQPKSAMDENWAESDVKNALRAGESKVSHAVLCLNDQGGSMMNVAEGISGTLRAQEHGHQPTILDMSHACDVIRDCGGVCPSLQARAGTGGNQVPLTYQMQGFGDYRKGDIANSCKQRDSKGGTDLVCAVDCRNGTENPETNGTLQAHPASVQSLNLNNVVRQNMTVRRLTPLECERLQGFPDGWTDIGDWQDSKGRERHTTDSARYKALGNSIALPPWFYVLQKLSLCCGADWTMASLFDGIGGFPLIWETLNGHGTCLWASEIEEFPIAVTKIHFPEGGNTNG